MKRLAGKVAIVTGGGTGIGEAICKRFAEEGAVIIVCGFPHDPVDEVAHEIRANGGEAISFKGDIANINYARECVEGCVERYGKLDILINNAGVFPSMKELQEYPLAEIEYMLHNNLMSAIIMSRFALPHLHKTRGCIISAGSESGINGLANNTVYGGTKGFLHAFMKGLAVEQAKHGVRCNCVCPGPIDTAWTHSKTSDMDKDTEELMIKGTPMARRGTPEEVANVYLFLASDEASYVTGSLYLVDGGITVGKGAVGEDTPKKLRRQSEGHLDLKHMYEGATKANGEFNN